MIQLPTLRLGRIYVECIPTPKGWLWRAYQEYEISIELPNFYWGA